jgi:hypothetical protein
MNGRRLARLRKSKINRHQTSRDASMPKHIEAIVTRVPFRDADSAQLAATPPIPVRAAPPVTPVYGLPDLAPQERVTELRLRVMSGVYNRHEVVEAVAHVLVSGIAIRG